MHLLLWLNIPLLFSVLIGRAERKTALNKRRPLFLRRLCNPAEMSLAGKTQTAVDNGGGLCSVHNRLRVVVFFPTAPL